MEHKYLRNGISLLIIAAMIFGIFTVPVVGHKSEIQAAGPTVKIKFRASGAKFIKQKVKNSKGKKVKTYLKTKKVTRGKKYGKLAKVKRTGYKFKGWYTKKKAGKKITAKSKVKAKKKQTLYARWAKRIYTITFDSKGGFAVPSKKVKYDDPYGELEVARRPGCTFLGWYNSDNIKITSGMINKTASNQTLIAKWSVGGKAIGSAYMDALGKTISELTGLTKEYGPIYQNGKTYVTYVDINDVEYLFEDNKCIAVNGTSLLSNVPEEGFTLSQMEAEYGKGRLSEHNDFKTYYEFKVGNIYTVIEFENGLVSPSSWALISIYNDENVMNILEKLYKL